MGLFRLSVILLMMVPFSALASETGTETASNDAVEETVHPEPALSVNVNVIGLLFSSYSGNFEYLWKGSHGLLLEPSYAFSEGERSSVTDMGVSLGYRWHWEGQQNSGFLGLNAGYASGTGTQDLDGIDFKMTIDRISVIPNIGYRAFWDFGLNITFRIGAGYGKRTVTAEVAGGDAEEAAQAMEDFLNVLPIALDGELSVGWCF